MHRCWYLTVYQTHAKYYISREMVVTSCLKCLLQKIKARGNQFPSLPFWTGKRPTAVSRGLLGWRGCRLLLLCMMPMWSLRKCIHLLRLRALARVKVPTRGRDAGESYWPYLKYGRALADQIAGSTAWMNVACSLRTFASAASSRCSCFSGLSTRASRSLKLQKGCQVRLKR